MSSNKWIKETPVDRLSALPDSIIIHILSLLEVKQAAITAVLSKRWQFLWRESPRLIFREKSVRAEKVRDFVTNVHRTLVVCGRNGLETFRVEFSYSKILSLDVDVWVYFAVKNKVKKVSLLLNSSSSTDFYTMPQMMFHNSYLKRLRLRRCIVTPRKTIEWRCLTKLRIERAEVQQHVIEKILSGCPVLYCFFLKYCWGFNRLEVGSKSLYKLWVCDHDGGVNEPLLQISAPYVRSLWVSLYAKGRKLRLENVSSLVRAIIGFIGSDWVPGSVEVMNNVKEILEIIQHVKAVETRGGYNEVLSSMAMNGYQFPQSTRTCLLVNAPQEKRSIHGIVGLLESSPNLEALVIKGFGFDGEPYSCPNAKGDLDCDLLHLKTITIRNFVHPDLVGEPMLTLARMLLNKAPALEKIVVNVEGIAVTGLALSEPFKIAQTLLSYPRSSKKAVILLN